MPLFVIIRHGQSQWNAENRFTGSVDSPLTDLGRQQAREAGTLLKAYRPPNFGIGFTSCLQRSIETMSIILTEIDQTNLLVERSETLNERMYGDLQGLDKDEAEARFGVDQVFLWRRGYNDRPPNGESLADTQARVIPYFKTAILPYLQAGQPVLVVAHGNSLRALVMELEHINAEDITKVELATGVPREYQYDPEANEFHLLPK